MATTTTTSIQHEIDVIKTGLRSLNELLQKEDGPRVNFAGLGEEFGCMAAMLKEAETSYKTKASQRKPIVASKKEGAVGDKKLPDAIKTIYNVSNELKKLSEIDPDEPVVPEKPPQTKSKTDNKSKAKSNEGKKKKQNKVQAKAKVQQGKAKKGKGKKKKGKETSKTPKTAKK